jgi:hypothetical protein
MRFPKAFIFSSLEATENGGIPVPRETRIDQRFPRAGLVGSGPPMTRWYIQNPLAEFG